MVSSDCRYAALTYLIKEDNSMKYLVVEIRDKAKKARDAYHSFLRDQAANQVTKY